MYEYSYIRSLSYDEADISSVVFGNPFDDYLSISIPYSGETTIELLSIDGRLVKSAIKMSKGIQTIPTGDLASGK